MTSTSQHQVYEKNMFWKNLITLPYIVVVQRWLKYTKVKKEYFFFLSFPRRSFSSGSRRAFLSFLFVTILQAGAAMFSADTHIQKKDINFLLMTNRRHKFHLVTSKLKLFCIHICARVCLTVCLYYFLDNI